MAVRSALRAGYPLPPGRFLAVTDITFYLKNLACSSIPNSIKIFWVVFGIKHAVRLARASLFYVKFMNEHKGRTILYGSHKSTFVILSESSDGSCVRMESTIWIFYGFGILLYSKFSRARGREARDMDRQGVTGGAQALLPECTLEGRGRGGGDSL
jgi:hypothetical protein